MAFNDTPNHYLAEDLADTSDDALIGLLKAHWGFEEDQPIEVIGKLRERKPARDGPPFYVLEQLHSAKDGRLLLYPLDDTGLRHTIFVGGMKLPSNASSLDRKWATVHAELSPKPKREEQNNPFGLRVRNGGLQLLTPLPDNIATSEISIEGRNYIEDWIVDYYRAQHLDKIKEEADELQERLNSERQQAEKRISLLQEKATSLSDAAAHGKAAVNELTEELSRLRQHHDEEQRAFDQTKYTMERQLDTLNQYIESKAQLLLELDLIDPQDVDMLLGRTLTQSHAAGHDFAEAFSSDPKKAVSYIQSFMHHKGIVYRRKLLEDFFALLTTHDLIILAGDSGSGKTNLVKSFAKAIGAEARIVPVKPNWTSAEDLLGYYNPLEKKYLATPFLEALFEASRNPETPYLICLDEMNLARVEYYFADFLSLLEERTETPEIHLYSDSEGSHLVSETRNFLSLIDETKARLEKPQLATFLDLLRDEEVNAKLHEMCGFQEGDSLLKYHNQLRKLIGSYLNTPSTLKLPQNVRVIGAINVDETTHYLSPKILDRAHIVRFGSPLMADWDKVEDEVESYDIDLDLPIEIDAYSLGNRAQYPAFDRHAPLARTLIELVREYLEPLGVEFGLRTIRQALHYSAALQKFGAGEQLILNNIVLHKVLPKLMFDGEKQVSESIARKDLLRAMRNRLDELLTGLDDHESVDYCVHELDRVIRNAEANDWVVNYWSR